MQKMRLRMKKEKEKVYYNLFLLNYWNCLEIHAKKNDANEVLSDREANKKRKQKIKEEKKDKRKTKLSKYDKKKFNKKKEQLKKKK